MPKTSTLAELLENMRDIITALEQAKNTADAVVDHLDPDSEKWDTASDYADSLEDVIYSLNEAADALAEIA